MVYTGAGAPSVPRRFQFDHVSTYRKGLGMGFLSGKRALIVGVASDRSIAWGIAQAMHREGAELAFSYVNEKIKERVETLAHSVGSRLIKSNADSISVSEVTSSGMVRGEPRECASTSTRSFIFSLT